MLTLAGIKCTLPSCAPNVGGATSSVQGSIQSLPSILLEHNDTREACLVGKVCENGQRTIAFSYLWPLTSSVAANFNCGDYLDIVLVIATLGSSCPTCSGGTCA